MIRAAPSLRRKLCISAAMFGACGLLLFGLELRLRNTGLHPPGALRSDGLFGGIGDDGQIIAHHERFFALAPGFRTSADHAGMYANGSWPFRGRAPAPKEAGLATVLVLGDSCTYGWGVEPADTLPHRLQLALAERGVPPSAAQVLNLGVPAYSTVQIRLLLDEVLVALHPDVVVVLPAAWNDQNPALGDNDLVLRERGPPSACARLLARSALVRACAARIPAGPTPEERADILIAWGEGRAPFGERVPEAQLPLELAGIVSACRAAGAAPVFVAAAHPVETARRLPRTRRDAATVLRVAAEQGVPCLDQELLFRASGRDDDALFMDFVHPHARALAILEGPLADAVLPLLPAERLAPRADAPAIAAMEPAVLPAMGDTQLVIRLARDAAQPIAATVGGAPLLDARLVTPRELVGFLGSNRAGRHGVVVQSATGAAWAPDAVELAVPALELAAEPRGLRVRSRPGDGVAIFVAQALGPPSWSPQGFFGLDPATARILPLRTECGPGGVCFIALPEGLSRACQAFVVPFGLDASEGLCGRWSNAVEIAPDRAGCDAPSASGAAAGAHGE